VQKSIFISALFVTLGVNSSRASLTTAQKLGAGLGISLGAGGAYNTYKFWKLRKNRALSLLTRRERVLEALKTLGALGGGVALTYASLREGAAQEPASNSLRTAPAASAVATPLSQEAEPAYEQLRPGFDLDTGWREKKIQLVGEFLAPVEARFENPEAYRGFLALAIGRASHARAQDYFAAPAFRQLTAAVEDKEKGRIPAASGVDVLFSALSRKVRELYKESPYKELRALAGRFERVSTSAP